MWQFVDEQLEQFQKKLPIRTSHALETQNVDYSIKPWNANKPELRAKKQGYKAVFDLPYDLTGHNACDNFFAHTHLKRSYITIVEQGDKTNV